MGASSWAPLLANNNVHVRCREAGNHRQQGIIECVIRTLAERLFGSMVLGTVGRMAQCASHLRV